MLLGTYTLLTITIILYKMNILTKEKHSHMYNLQDYDNYEKFLL